MRADLSVTTSLNLINIQFVPSIGSASFLLPRTAFAFSRVFDTPGVFDRQFNSINDGEVTAMEMTALARGKSLRNGSLNSLLKGLDLKFERDEDTSALSSDERVSAR